MKLKKENSLIEQTDVEKENARQAYFKEVERRQRYFHTVYEILLYQYGEKKKEKAPILWVGDDVDPSIPLVKAVKPRRMYRGTSERVMKFHRLVKKGVSYREARKQSRLSPMTYLKWCVKVTGQKPISSQEVQSTNRFLRIVNQMQDEAWEEDVGGIKV